MAASAPAGSRAQPQPLGSRFSRQDDGCRPASRRPLPLLNQQAPALGLIGAQPADWPDDLLLLVAGLDGADGRGARGRGEGGESPDVKARRGAVVGASLVGVTGPDLLRRFLLEDGVVRL